MRRQGVRGHVAAHHGAVPMGQRVDLQEAVLAVLLEQLQPGPARPLGPLAPGDPGTIRLQGAAQRQGLAQEAAGVGVVAVQRAVGVVARQIVRIGPDQPQVGQAEPRGQFALIDQRLRKKHAGFQEQHRGGALYPRDHVQQHRRIRPERRDQRHAVAVLVADHVVEQHNRLAGRVNPVQHLRVGVRAEAPERRLRHRPERGGGGRGFCRHSREGGNLAPVCRDPRLRGDDG